jgi:hypothetical protein
MPSRRSSARGSTDPGSVHGRFAPLYPAERNEGAILYWFDAKYPYMIQIATELVMKPGYSYSAEFEFELDLILDGLERLRAEA